MTAMPADRGPTDRVPVAGPSVTDLEIGYVVEAARGAWYGGAGSFVRRFEAAFAGAVGRQRATALPSCTAGLHLALAALGVGPGDEVIVPDTTWIATVAPVCYLGAEPVFADVDPDTWCIRADAVAACRSERTRAVIAVDLYGGMPDMAALEAELGGAVPIVEDAAEAVGSRIGDRSAGSFGVASAFSFHGSKTVTTGEGGMVLTDDDALWERMLVLRDHGRSPGDTSFRNGEIGFKYKMSDLQAAFGLGQIERLDELVQLKRKIFGWYRDRLAGRDDLRLNAEPAGTTNSYWMVTVVLDDAPPLDRLRAALTADGIDNRPVFPPLSSLPAFAGTAVGRVAKERNSVAYALGSSGINLPSALSIDEADVDRACAALDRALGR